MIKNNHLNNKQFSIEVLVQDYYIDNNFYLLNTDNNNWELQKTELDGTKGNVLGFGVYIPTEKKNQFVAYFAKSRKSMEQAPEYKSGILFYFSEKIFDLNSPDVKISFHMGFWYRDFSIYEFDKKIASHKYRWPFYKELWQRLFGDPFNFVSKDFFFEAKKIFEVYCPGRFI